MNKNKVHPAGSWALGYEEDVVEIMLADGWHRVTDFRYFEQDHYSREGDFSRIDMFDCMETETDLILEGPRSSVLARRQEPDR